MTKDCVFKCGTKVWWDNKIPDSESKIKWREKGTNILHNYPRCADLLKAQGKDLSVLKRNIKK